MEKIALVRGHHLSKEETISYEPLKNDFDFVCFSTNNPWFNHSEIQFPITQVPSAEGLFRFLPANLHNRAFGFVDGILGAGQWMYGLEKFLKGFDIVHTSDYCHYFTYQAARAKKKLGYRLAAIHYENIPFARDNKPVVRRMKQELYNQADAMFAMSKRAKEALILEGYDRERIFVIGNAVDTEKFKPSEEENHIWRKRFGIKQDDIVILFVGRIRASKGVFELVYAAKKLLSDSEVDPSRLKVVIAGRGPREKQVRARINQLGIGKNVLMIGGVPHSEIHLLHNIADIFTLPSLPRKYWQEQFGIVLIESMACQKAVVSTFSGSIPEVVGDSGILVQPNDHYSLYLALKSLILDKRLRKSLGEQARNQAINIFGLDEIANKLKKAYTTVLNMQ